MHLFTLDVFDDIISGTGGTWDSASIHNGVLGSADVISIHAVTTGVSGTSPTLTVRLQSAADGEYWTNAATNPEINGLAIANETILVGTNTAAGMIQANARLRITLGGTSPKCRLRLSVTGRAYGSGRR
jgi:hypothetical protein